MSLFNVETLSMKYGYDDGFIKTVICWKMMRNDVEFVKPNTLRNFYWFWRSFRPGQSTTAVWPISNNRV